MSRIKLYIRNVMVGVDQLGNTLIGGDPDETISSRVGKAAQRGDRLGLALELVINALFWPVDGWGHCRACIEPDEGDREVIRL